MDLIFPAPSTRHPSGGVAVIFDLAMAMARRGHRVHLYHVGYFQADVRGPEDIGWFDFSGDVVHHFPEPGFDPATIPRADVIFGYTSEEHLPPQVGLPVVLIQGYKMLDEEAERHAFTAPCPKICVAGWLVDVGLDLGVPANQLLHLPPGLRHGKYRLTRPLADRPPRVSFCYSAHPRKGPRLAIEVLEDAKARVPELEVTAFGAAPPEHPMPDWMRYRLNPPQAELVDEVYNSSRIFLSTSTVEGFGLTAVEAMAGGAALVTTDNGGSRDYARHGETALVAPPGARGELVDHVVHLLRDDDARRRLAGSGLDFVQRFDWDRTAQELESFLERYLAAPGAYGRPAVGPGSPQG